ncbi:MAG: cytochrome c-type biosis protein CcmE [Deltaproteobacteria bacterium]|nr:cytochrome c-type biosis protein CcmE [Deltaproteobacteria bacterium]
MPLVAEGLIIVMQNSTLAKIVLTAAVAVAGVGFFVKSTLGHTQEYMMVDQLLASGDLSQWKGKELKVHGWVVAGSIKEEVVNQQTVRTFLLQKEGKKIRIFSKGPKPDTFKDQSEVVATGRIIPSAERKALASDLKINIETDLAYVVDATDLQAKCPSKYEGAQVNKNLNTTKFE